MPGKGGFDVILAIIEKKKQGEELTREEIAFFVERYTGGEIPDYQISALLMAIYFRGFSERELFDLTDVMLHSGEILDFRDLGTVADKHSTGGVGDKVTLVAAPIMAAGGLKVAKMSGAGLGHTGGTIDKLAAVPGLTTDLGRERFKNQVKTVGMAICGQSDAMVPADKKLYALRDVTGTVDSLPLIAASILAKKLALSPQLIVFDVKFGGGAFMKSRAEGEALARAMNDIAAKSGVQAASFLSRMETPLGRAVGNGLEVAEAYRTLAGEIGGDVRESALSIAGCSFWLAGYVPDLAAGYERAARLLDGGAGLDLFFSFLEAQGGRFRRPDFVAALPKAKEVWEVKAKASGYIAALDSLKIARAAQGLGAGRSRIGDAVDPAAGVYLNRIIGEEVRAGEVLATLYGREGGRLWSDLVGDAYTLSPQAPKPLPHIAGLIPGQNR